jgi:DNA (cytosine-5)-methyltransferase 1
VQNSFVIRELSLFTGAGGGLLASRLLGWETIGYVESEDYCQRVVAQRIADGILDVAPIFGDIRAFADQWAERYRGVVDVITAGFPCQPFSLAGRRLGGSDKRNMWPHTVRVIQQVQPTWALLENSPGIASAGCQYFGTILRDLAKIGYSARWGVLSAAGVGAPHWRKRMWVVAHADRIDADGR